MPGSAKGAGLQAERRLRAEAEQLKLRWRGDGAAADLA
jgi:hypothetical protein